MRVLYSRAWLLLNVNPVKAGSPNDRQSGHACQPVAAILLRMSKPVEVMRSMTGFHHFESSAAHGPILSVQKVLLMNVV